MPLLITGVVAPRFLPGGRRGWSGDCQDHCPCYRDRGQSVPYWMETRSSHGGLPQAFLSDNLCWSSGAWSKASKRATGRAGSKSGSIPMSIPTDRNYIGRDTKGYREDPRFGYAENQKRRIRIAIGMNQHVKPYKRSLNTWG